MGRSIAPLLTYQLLHFIKPDCPGSRRGSAIGLMDNQIVTIFTRFPYGLQQFLELLPYRYFYLCASIIAFCQDGRRGTAYCLRSFFRLLQSLFNLMRLFMRWEKWNRGRPTCCKVHPGSSRHSYSDRTQHNLMITFLSCA